MHTRDARADTLEILREEKVTDCILQAIDDNHADELMVFYDLGSAKMNLDLVTDMTDKTLHRYDVAFVEGAYTAAALLQAGDSRTEIEKQLAPLKIK